MGGNPMAGNVGASAHPHRVTRGDVVKKAREARGPARMADDPGVEAYRHHLRRGRAFGIEHVEGILQIDEEVVGGRHRSTDELGVVVDQTIGDDQVRLAADRDPVGQLVIVGVGIVEEAPSSATSRRVFTPAP